MPNRVRMMMLMVALATLTFVAQAAKPDYCLKALKNCMEECRSYIEPVSSACMAGCSIGYLSCGS